MSEGHVDEYVWQCNEDEGRAFGWFYAECRACREDDEACHQGYECVKRGDSDCFAAQGVVAAHVAGEDFHGALADGECEECLVHGSSCHVSNACFDGAVPVRKKVEFDAFGASRKEKAVYGEDNDEAQEAEHHDFRDFFKALGNAACADGKADEDVQAHEEYEFIRISDHGIEGGCNFLRPHAIEGSVQEFPEVVDHPARYDGVVNHEDEAAQKADPPVPVPFAAFRLQCLEAHHGALVAGASDGQFHRDDRYPQY